MMLLSQLMNLFKISPLAMNRFLSKRLSTFIKSTLFLNLNLLLFYLHNVYKYIMDLFDSEIKTVFDFQRGKTNIIIKENHN